MNNEELIKYQDKSLIAQAWDFMKVNKKWWLLPIIILLILTGALIVFGSSSSLTPFIYALG